MSVRVETVRPDDAVSVAREVFGRRRCRHVPVVVAGRVVGIVSDRDLRAAVDDATSVDAVMTPTPATTTPATPIEDAATMMRMRKIGALPVLEGETLVGIVSESDLLTALVELCSAMDPSAVLEVQCDDDSEAPGRVRQVVERAGGSVAWMTAIRTQGGRQNITVRMRVPPPHGPRRLLEEAGFTVTSCLMGRAAANH